MFFEQQYNMNGIKGKLFAIDREDGNTEYLFRFNDPNEHNNYNNLTLTIKKNNTVIKNICLYLSNEFERTGKARNYTSGYILNIDPESEIIISKEGANHD